MYKQVQTGREFNRGVKERKDGNELYFIHFDRIALFEINFPISWICQFKFKGVKFFSPVIAALTGLYN